MVTSFLHCSLPLFFISYIFIVTFPVNIVIVVATHYYYYIPSFVTSRAVIQLTVEAKYYVC
jgi:hypothetical protein